MFLAVVGFACAAFQGHHLAPWTISHRTAPNNVFKIAAATLPLEEPGPPTPLVTLTLPPAPALPAPPLTLTSPPHAPPAPPLTLTPPPPALPHDVAPALSDRLPPAPPLPAPTDTLTSPPAPPLDARTTAEALTEVRASPISIYKYTAPPTKSF